jgi:hypothetical protein
LIVRFRSRTERRNTLFSRKSLFVTIAVFFALGAAAPSLAGKGGGSSETATIALNQPLAAATAVSWPALGSSVDFATAYPRGTKNPRIEVRCYDAAGSLVYAEAGDTAHVFDLGGYASNWKTNGGSASCTARLFDLVWNGNNPQQVTWLALTSFNAAG